MLKMYVIFKDNADNHLIGYYYFPKSFRKMKKFIKFNNVRIYNSYYGSEYIKKSKIVKRNKSLKQLRRNYPQYFI